MPSFLLAKKEGEGNENRSEGERKNEVNGKEESEKKQREQEREGERKGRRERAKHDLPLSNSSLLGSPVRFGVGEEARDITSDL